MWINAKNGKVAIDNTYMDFATYGKGDKLLIMIPGLGDGLKTVKNMALPLALMYRELGKKYRVYIFSRKRDLPEVYSSKDMAADLAHAIKLLGIEKADIMGVSQGGTVAQYLALEHPELVHKLVLTVTYARQNETIQKVIKNWIGLVKADDYAALMIDTAEKSYSEKYLKKNRVFYPLLTRVGKPKSFRRFLILADACLRHDAYDALCQIACPTLVIGGKQDKIVTAEASLELAEAIPDAEVFLYEEYGHGVYEEAKDFCRRVIEFLERHT